MASRIPVLIVLQVTHFLAQMAQIDLLILILILIFEKDEADLH